MRRRLGNIYEYENNEFLKHPSHFRIFWAFYAVSFLHVFESLEVVRRRRTISQYSHSKWVEAGFPVGGCTAARPLRFLLLLFVCFFWLWLLAFDFGDFKTFYFWLWPCNFDFGFVLLTLAIWLWRFDFGCWLLVVYQGILRCVLRSMLDSWSA